MTKREIYDVIGTVFESMEHEHRDEVLEMIAKEKAALDRKNEKAKERAAEKRVAGDELRGRIEAVIGDEPITVNEIIDALNEEGLTPAKVTARTRQLINAGIVGKETVKVDGRKLIAYFKM